MFILVSIYREFCVTDKSPKNKLVFTKITIITCTACILT